MRIVILSILVSVPVQIHAQLFLNFDLFEASRYARTIGMGNAYTGVAEGVEAIHYNTAGIAGMDHASFIFSNGQGNATNLRGIADYALAVPLEGIGVAAVSYSRHDLENYFQESAGTLNLARKLTGELSVGLDIHYYSYKIEFLKYRLDSVLTETMVAFHSTAFDVSPSFLYVFHHPFNPQLDDRLRLGVVIRNALGTRVSTSATPSSERATWSDDKFQMVRFGASYSLTPPLDRISSFTPIRLLFAGDLVFLGSNYSFKRWQPNFGLEITVLDILRLRYGRENENTFDEKTRTNSIQFPVSRYGLGVVVPISMMKEKGFPFGLEIDYTISDWQKLDEHRGFYSFGPIKKDAISVKLNASW